MKRTITACCTTLLLVTTQAGLAQPWPDAPDPAFRRNAVSIVPGAYAQALASWRTAEDVSDWIGAHFVYDPDRALALSASAGNRSARAEIHGPEAFFAHPQGVCVDLARFGVETLHAIDPASAPSYLMIEFTPVTIAGSVLRLHWLAAFRRNGSLYFFADSRRPGHIAGPYADVQAFIDDYAGYRERQIVRHRSLPSYRRTPRSMAIRPAPEAVY